MLLLMEFKLPSTDVNADVVLSLIMGRIGGSEDVLELSRLGILLDL